MFCLLNRHISVSYTHLIMTIITITITMRMKYLQALAWKQQQPIQRLSLIHICPSDGTDPVITINNTLRETFTDDTGDIIIAGNHTDIIAAI